MDTVFVSDFLSSFVQNCHFTCLTLYPGWFSWFDPHLSCFVNSLLAAFPAANIQPGQETRGAEKSGELMDLDGFQLCRSKQNQHLQG